MRTLILAAFVIGFSSMLAQVVVLREALAGFYSNELILGVILANYLLLTGIGGYLGKYLADYKKKPDLLIFNQILISIFALTAIFLFRIIRNIISIPGELIGLWQIMFYSFLILLPLCLLFGMQFTLLASAVLERTKERVYWVSNIYIIDSAGNIIAGIVFSYFLIFILNSFQVIYILVFLNLFSGFLLAGFINNRNYKFLIIFFTIAFIFFFYNYNLNDITARFQYPDQQIISNENSIYGNLVITKIEDQLNFYENGFPLFTTENTFRDEEVVHYAMSQHLNPRRVLLISGGVSGIVDELLKYKIEKIDYVELDPLIIEAGRKYTDSLKSEKINTINQDGRYFIKNTENRYDVIIIDLPDPDSTQINRFYTEEFFREAKNVLDKRGIISLSLSGGENYLTLQQAELNSINYKTLSREFENIIIIPGDTNYFIASDSVLDYNIKDKLKERGISTEYIQYYIDGKITEDRLDFINNAIKQSNNINYDFKPLSYFIYQKYWLSFFRLNIYYLIFIVSLILLGILYFIRLKPIPLSILVTGFTGTSVLLLTSFAFQIIYGFLYFKISLFITAFMVGIVGGAFLINRILRKKVIEKKYLASYDFTIFAYLTLMPLIILNLNKLNDLISIEVVFPVLIIIIGFLVGAEFPIALRLYKEKGVINNFAMLYAVDLIGACLGALLMSALLVPLLGLVNVFLIIGVLNLITGFYLLSS